MLEFIRYESLGTHNRLFQCVRKRLRRFDRVLRVVSPSVLREDHYETLQ